ncbi:HsdS Restriction endonuclease S subunits [Burkholderiaceae bacterium]
MNWPIVKLGDVAFTTSGGTPKRDVKAYYGGNINWVKSGELHCAIVMGTEELITPEAVAKSSAKIMPVGTILLAMYGATVGAVSELGIAAATNQAVCCIQPSDKIDKGYLKAYLKSIKTYLLANRVGGAQPNLSQDLIRNLKIKLPPLAEQRCIAAILDKAEEIERNREQTVAKLDQLAQSTFVEMFGNPVSNNKKWSLTKLGASVTKLGSGSTPTGGDASYKDQGISLIRSLNVHDGEFAFKNLAFIDEEQAAKLANVQVKKGDVLLNITGASVARVCRVPDEVLPARVNQHVMIVRPSETLNPIFLERLLLSSQMKRKLLQIGGAGATREAITKAQAEKLEIICPPLKLQIEFARHIERILALKNNGLQAIDKHVALRSSLHHKAFTTGFRA